MIERIRETVEGAQFGVNGQKVLAALLVLTLASSGIAAAQSTSFFDGFEDGDISEYSGDTGAFTVDESPSAYEGNYHLVGTAESGANIITREVTPEAYSEVAFAYNPESAADPGFLFTTRDSSDSIGVNLDMTSGGYIRYYSGGWTNTSIQLDPMTQYTVNILNVDYSNSTYDIRVVNVDAGTVQSYSNAVFTSPITEMADYRLYQYNSDRSYDAISLGDSLITDPEMPENASLTLKHNNYMEFGTTQPYTVIYENETGRHNVTTDANVTSANTSVVAFNSNYTMTATSDENVSVRVTTTANYTLPNGTTITDTNYVAVAEPDVKNLEVLPPIWRFSASFGSPTIQAILVAVLMGVFAGRLAGAFAGLGMMQLVMVAGWFAGYVSVGMAMISLFTALFIGLNMAANIDYTVTRG